MAVLRRNDAGYLRDIQEKKNGEFHLRRGNVKNSTRRKDNVKLKTRKRAV